MDFLVEWRVEWTKDLFPEDHKYLTFLKKVFRHEFRKNSFRRLSIPSFEYTSLLRKAFPKGENTYGLYTFSDKKGNDLSLAPNATIWAMRAYLTNEIFEQLQPVHYYYMDKFIRQEREEKECYIIGWEVIGESDPIIDVEMIYMTYICIQKMWLGDDIKIRINSYGNQKEMINFKDNLKDFYANKEQILTPETKELMQRDILSVFSTEDEDEKILLGNTISIHKFLKKDSKKHYEKVKEYLTDLGIPFIEDHTLFFRENFYTNTVWTISTQEGELLSRWGRYNILSEMLWSQKKYAAGGFAVDAMKLVNLLKRKNISIRNKDKVDLYFVQLWDKPKKVVLPLAIEARNKGINTLASLGTPSIKEQMLKAQRIGSRFIVIVGVMEAMSWVFQVRDMDAGTQAEVKKEELIDYVIERIGKDNLDFYEPSRDLLQEELKKEAE